MYFMSSELTAPSTATLRRQLGKEGLFRLGVPRSLGGHGGTKEDVVRAVAVVAKRHPKSGVLLASQRLLIEVLLQAENIGVMEYQLPDLLDGHIGGKLCVILAE
jgi:alkylation response protein AidB-like acyl-CoA dehydrogenase